MKTPEEMREFFRSMPAKKKENPYWTIDAATQRICSVVAWEPMDEHQKATVTTLKMVREFFRRFYEAFHTEAQVLCVTPKDAEALSQKGIPTLGYGTVGPYGVAVMVLPQDNHMGTSVVSEAQWQDLLVRQNITPVLRIHSHHVLEPYQSSTDYASLNSGTLEMVLGRIFEEDLNLCYWLDILGTNQKAQTFVVKQTGEEFVTVPYVFHKPDDGSPVM